MPDNAVYYHAAYVTAAVLYGAYILSLVWRARGGRTSGAGDLDTRVGGARDR